MGDKTGIQWTDATWNPMVGCDRVSPGCAHCYAKALHDRRHQAYRPDGEIPIQYSEPFETVQFFENKLDQPLRWRRPRKIFVNSMSDLFHDDVPVDYIARVGGVMRDAHWHMFQVLTKRHERLRCLLRGELHWMSELRNIAFGVSAEDRRHGLPRIAALQETPAQTRFLSIEPLLEPLGPLNLSGVHWVIVGGESGPRARPMSKSWVVEIRRACRAQRVPFFFKQ